MFEVFFVIIMTLDVISKVMMALDVLSELFYVFLRLY